MWAEQNKKCDICKKTIKFSEANVDHCHNTGKIRGVLCMYCNYSIARFQDSVEYLNNAIIYLKKIKGE